MTIRSILLGSAAALVAVSGARAADAVVVAEPEAVEYVRVCDAYGKGFFYIPGTETCLKISGYLRYDAAGGDDVYNGGEFGTWQKKSRATVRFDARSETELGTLRSYIETRFDYTNGVNSGGSIPQAYIELGGFRIGVSDEIFGSFTGYAGDVINDDVINYQSGTTNQVSYTFTGGNGFSAIIAAEQGSGSFDTVSFDPITGDPTFTEAGGNYRIDDYMPHVLAGAKFEQSWGAISGVVGYDSKYEEWAAKLRLDVKFSETVKGFVMGGYQTDGDVHEFNGVSYFKPNWFGLWHGDYAIWGGLSAKVSEKATINGQLAYEADGTYAAALNVNYELVPGFVITPEVNYTKFDGIRGDDDAFGGMIRFQRNF